MRKARLIKYVKYITIHSDMQSTKSLLVSAALVGAIAGGITAAAVSINIAPTFTQKSASPEKAPVDSYLESVLPSSREPSGASDEESQTIAAVERARPAVVSIIITKQLEQFSSGNDFPLNDFFQFGFPFDPFRLEAPQQRANPRAPKSQPQEVGGGSGFLISSDGLVLTNKHVVSDTEAEYTVVTNDGKRYKATVVGRDPSNDLAVVRISGRDFPTVTLGDSSTLRIGQTVIAIGNVLSQYRNTVTKGVVSGIGRRVVAGDDHGSSEVLEEAIQTDAAINPGNSGGPLLNLRGEVIGINTAINRGGQLVGFAIPISSVKVVIEGIKKNGRIIRPWLGVRYVLITEQMSKENSLSVNYGALVVRGQSNTDLAVVPGSPADKAGIEENDIILAVGGLRIDEKNTLAKAIAKYAPGQIVNLRVQRKGKEMTIAVKLEEFKQ